jgi:hypothetical protein
MILEPNLLLGRSELALRHGETRRRGASAGVPDKQYPRLGTLRWLGLAAAGAALFLAACGGEKAPAPTPSPPLSVTPHVPADFFPVTVIVETDKAWTTIRSLTAAETSSGESGVRLNFEGSVEALSAGTFNYRLSVTDSNGETYKDSGGMLLGERQEGENAPFQTSITVPAEATLTFVGFWLADTDVLALSYHVDLPVAAIPPSSPSSGVAATPSPSPTVVSPQGEPGVDDMGIRPDYVLQGLPEVLASFGYALASGDVNGDGHDDVIVGAPWPEVTPGKVLLFLGNSEFGSHPDIVLPEPDGSQSVGFGHFLAAGDLSGDGRDEIVVGNPFGTGRVYVFSEATDPPEMPVAVLEDPEGRTGSFLGYPVVIGDVNADGHDDVIAGAPQLDVDGQTDAGGVLVFLGGDPLDAVCDFVLQAPQPEAGAWFGRSVAAGDVNGDGLDDIIVGAHGSSPGGHRSAGQVFVFLSGGSYEAASAHVLQDPTPQEEARLGYAVAAGDTDGDGYDDVIAAAFGSAVDGRSGAGKALVFRGAADLDATADAVLSAPDPEAGAGFGYVAQAADLNGDGFDDIIIGSPYSNLGSHDAAGEAFLFFGGRTPSGEADEILVPFSPQDYAYFGISVASGDIDGDGAVDVVVGGYRASADGQAGAGQVYVFLSPAS